MSLGAQMPPSPAGRTAGDVMSAPAITVSIDATRAQVAGTLTRHRISGAPVIDEAGRIVGVISEFDLLADSGNDVRALMTTAVISVSADSPVDDVAHLLVERRIHRLPVLRDGELVGVVSRHDLIAAMATEWVCQVCGESVHADQPPQSCPKCHVDAGGFVLQEQPPGA
jgi:CBS domain-containing protein